VSEYVTELPWPVTRYECPISTCSWTRDDTGISGVIDGEDGIFPAMRKHAALIEAVVREHLETHPLLDWAKEVSRLREQAQRADRDAVLTAAVLVRRLGGEVQVSDAELAAAGGRLVREPAPWGFILRTAE
jgi:hypothetical protein